MSDPFIAGIISGLMSSLVVTLAFYVLGARDLKREADDLRRLNELLIRGLDNAGIVNVNYDSNGKPKGIIIAVRVSDRIELSDSASANADDSANGDSND